MNKVFKIPPKTPKELTSLKILKKRLVPLIGTGFSLTRKSRTDGSNVRKLIAKTLEEYPLPKPAIAGEYEIVPPKKKGIPKITREFIDTYIVTSGQEVIKAFSIRVLQNDNSLFNVSIKMI